MNNMMKKIHFPVFYHSANLYKGRAFETRHHYVSDQSNRTIATCDSADDAKMIVDALNALYRIKQHKQEKLK